MRLGQIIINNDDAKVQKALEEIRSGAGFEETAKKYSDSLNSGSSDIGWIAVDDLSDMLRKEIIGAGLNEIIGPISLGKTGMVFYQIREKGVAGEKTLDEVRPEIHQTLVKKYQQEAFSHWLEKMMTQYYIGKYL